jgi:hypothetical protein
MWFFCVSPDHKHTRDFFIVYSLWCYADMVRYASANAPYEKATEALSLALNNPTIPLDA